ncbi:CD9 antigen-like [Diaphorina citri]|uniref:CD9 antigen-like n=1 Tax=Diaphorina citri TaxID=121845 RepID=A0A3Q0II28_DIACI|nr:CD9 antigen-like [Diaphorina citri]
MLTDPTFYVRMAQDESNYYAGVYLLLSVGLLLFIVGFLGCCGAYRESRNTLTLFFCFLLIVLVAQISAVVWGYANLDQLESLIRSNVASTVRHEYGVISSRTFTFDSIQEGVMIFFLLLFIFVNIFSSYF